jgi:adenosylmethionine-8-amino-7-oxononanoate aminotransferase
MKHMFEPVTPGGFRVPNTNYYRAAESGFGGGTPEEFGLWAADRIEQMIQFEGPRRSPPCSSSRCRTPADASRPAGYFQRVREICDRYDVLLVSDEVICAFGRLGHYFGARPTTTSPT